MQVFSLYTEICRRKAVESNYISMQSNMVSINLCTIDNFYCLNVNVKLKKTRYNGAKYENK